jgi:hypothetical protein
MKNKPTIQQIVMSYELWGEYIDPEGIDSASKFNELTPAQRLAIAADCGFFMKNTQTFKAGATVRWSLPEPSEEADRFTVLEDRGNRVLVRHDAREFAEWRFVPTSVYAKQDLVLAEDEA